MRLDWLITHINALAGHLAHFQQMHQQLEAMYERSKRLQTDPDLQSALMEQYSRNLDRQQKSIDAMGELYQQACAQLARLTAEQG